MIWLMRNTVGRYLNSSRSIRSASWFSTSQLGVRLLYVSGTVAPRRLGNDEAAELGRLPRLQLQPTPMAPVCGAEDRSGHLRSPAAAHTHAPRWRYAFCGFDVLRVWRFVVGILRLAFCGSRFAAGVFAWNENNHLALQVRKSRSDHINKFLKFSASCREASGFTCPYLF